MEKDARFLTCPNCGKPTKIKIYEDTVLLHFPLCCSHCGQESIVHVVNCKMTQQEKERPASL